jgi:SynChlorMet cassette radical SAM/SPASM protein ScmF
VDYLTAEGLSLTMETNGTLIDEALARHLKEKTNLWHISVSIDGATAETHDAFRNVSGSFDKVLRGFRCLVEVGYRPQLIMSVYRDNVEEVENVVSLAINLGAGSVKFNPVNRTGRGWAIHQQGKTLSFEEIIDLGYYIREKLQDHVKTPLILSLPPAFYSIGDILKYGVDSRCNVHQILGVLSTGEMALCGIGYAIPDLCYGNLGGASLREIWEKHPRLKQLRQELLHPYPGICGECLHAKHCLTYCVAQNFEDTGKLVVPSRICSEAYRLGRFPMSRLKSIHNGS